jgi:hypothetical protein
MNAQEKINNTKSLDELCETLNSIVSELGEAGDELTIDQVVDVCSLPTFGGNDPKKTSEVWSWDATQVLVADGSAWSVEDRCACGEAVFHCRCKN